MEDIADWAGYIAAPRAAWTIFLERVKEVRRARGLKGWEPLPQDPITDQTPPNRPRTNAEIWDTWVVDVTVPANWNDERDREYVASESGLGLLTKNELKELVLRALADLHHMLWFAFGYLTRCESGQDMSIFYRLPLPSKVRILHCLFHKRTSDDQYLYLFEHELGRFLDVERLCMPVLERLLLQPATVWLRELTDVYLNISAAAHNFEGVLETEHADHPSYLNYLKFLSSEQVTAQP